MTCASVVSSSISFNSWNLQRQESSEKDEKRRVERGKKRKKNEKRKERKKGGDSKGGNKGFKKGRQKVKRRYELTTIMNNYNNKKKMNMNQMMRSNEEINKIEKY